MLYLARHGETVWNLEQRLQGQGDSALTERGHHQARATARLLAGAALARLYASPLGRARLTAAYVSELVGLAPEFDDRLMELRYGACEGLTHAEMEARHPGLVAWRAADKWSRRLPGAECYADITSRAAAFAAERLRAALGAGPPHVAVVAHSGFNTALAGHLLGWTAERIVALQQPNGIVYRIADGTLEELNGEAA